MYQTIFYINDVLPKLSVVKTARGITEANLEVVTVYGMAIKIILKLIIMLV